LSRFPDATDTERQLVLSADQFCSLPWDAQSTRPRPRPRRRLRSIIAGYHWFT